MNDLAAAENLFSVPLKNSFRETRKLRHINNIERTTVIRMFVMSIVNLLDNHLKLRMSSCERGLSFFAMFYVLCV